VRTRTAGYTAPQLRAMAAAYRATGRAYYGRQWEMEYCDAAAIDCELAADAIDPWGREKSEEIGPDPLSKD